MIDVILKEDIQYPLAFVHIDADEHQVIGKIISVSTMDQRWGRGLIGWQFLGLCLKFD